MLGFQVGLSALRSSQTAMDTIASNIANANTPGYHRRLVSQVESAPSYDGKFWRGTGAEIARINQIASYAIESAYTRGISDVSRVNEALDTVRQLEIKMAGPEGNLNHKINEFFSELQTFQGRPDDSTQRQIVVQNSLNLTSELRSLAAEVSQLKRTTINQVEQELTDLNGKLQRLNDLNEQISTAQSLGQNPLSLLDSHQNLVNEIAQSVDLKAIPEDVGFSYQFASDRVAIVHSVLKIEADFANDGTVVFHQHGSDSSLEFSGGRLASYQDSLNDILPHFNRQLDDLAHALIGEFNHIQATGVGSHGPFQEISSTYRVNDIDAPLSDAGLADEIVAGELFVSVYDSASNQRSLHRLELDPATQSLSDMAVSLSSIENIQAVVDKETQRLTIIAKPGFEFDFSGQLPSQPDRDDISGTAAIRFGGHYQEDANQQFQFEVQGSGQIGVADNLKLVVTDAEGFRVGEHNIGVGYEPGSEISLGNGINVQIDVGQLNDGDSFDVNGVNNPDTSRLLAGLGINTFFSGTSAHNIDVSDAILKDPGLMASGRTMATGDGSNIARFVATRSDRNVGSPGVTFEEQVDSMTSDIAILANHLQQSKEELDVTQANLLAERESISGVDPNEEMIEMLKYQRSFQAATRVITTIDETLQELMNMVR